MGELKGDANDATPKNAGLPDGDLTADHYPTPTTWTPPQGGWMWALRVLAVVGLALSIFLALHGSGVAALPGCGGDGSGCAAVQATKWAMWLFVPVGAMAAGVYAAALGSLCLTSAGRSYVQLRQLWSVLLVIAVLLLGAAGWFVGVQAMIVKSLCLYCMATHVVGVMLAAGIFVVGPFGQAGRSPGSPGDRIRLTAGGVLARGAIGIVLLGVLIAGQIATPERPSADHKDFSLDGQGEVDTGPGPEREVSVLGRRIGGIRPHDWPTMGSPDAPALVMLMYDYTCPHCRQLHRALAEVLPALGDELAVLMFPTPLDSDCNTYVSSTNALFSDGCELAGIALATWRIDRDAFATLDAWLAADEDSRSIEDTWSMAAELVGEAALQKEMDSKANAEMLQRTTLLWHGANEVTQGPRRLPTMISRGDITFGLPPLDDLPELLGKWARGESQAAVSLQSATQLNSTPAAGDTP